jgi:RHS repeat-associated protein
MPRSPIQPFARRVFASAVVALYLGQVAVAAPTRPEPGPPPGGGGGGGGGPTLPALTAPTAPIKLPGQGGVSDGGSATYSMPLWVPAGPAGMQPALTLEYNGGGGNGRLGVGFQLSGTSMIAPCPKTLSAEGYADGADYGIGEGQEAGFVDSSVDAFCLDGAKLVPNADPGFVPASSAFDFQYSTEIESYVRVVAHRAVASSVSPDTFTVHDPSGAVRTYLPIYGHVLGNAHDAVSELDPDEAKTALLYVITENVDKNGNRVKYQWDSETGNDEASFRLRRIEYSYANPTTPRRRVELEYESRPDLVITYVRGVKLVQRSRLSSLSMFAPNPTTVAKVMTYALRYLESAETGRSLLQKVQMCDQFSQCSWIRSFEYTGRDVGPLDWHVLGDVEFGPAAMGYDQVSLDRYHQDPSANWLEPTDVRLLLYDMDGDGDDDALYRTGRSWISAFFAYDLDTGAMYDHSWSRVWMGELKVRLSAEDMPLGLMGYEVSQSLEPGFRHPSIDPGDVFSYANLGSSRVADFDADGKLDLMLARTQVTVSGTVEDPLSDEATLIQRDDEWAFGFKLYPGKTWDHWADYPYDVTPGLDTTLIHGPVLRYGTSWGQLTVAKPPFQRIVADLDGDARPEVIDAIDHDIDSQDPPDIDWSDAESYFSIGTFNYHTTLTTDGSDMVFPQNWTCGNGQAMVVDQDGDGRQEVLVNGDLKSSNPELDPLVGQPTYRRLMLGDPVLAVPPSSTHGAALAEDTSKLWGGGCNGDQPDLVMGDWNGDGLQDALYPPGSYNSNTEPQVRWNLGRGFGPLEFMPVQGAPGIAALMEQEVPVGKQATQVAWDRGTRVADVDGDGRSDIVAFRQDNAACIDPVINSPLPLPWWGCENKLVVFRSHGDHFEGEELATWSLGGATIPQGFTLSQIGDVDGDGATDAVFPDNGQMNIINLPWKSQPDRLHLVKDTGSAYFLEGFYYSRSWWGDKPRQEATQTSPIGEPSSPTGPLPCAWPTSCPRRGAPVVRTHVVFRGTNTDGTAMWQRSYHRFLQPRVDLLGRGSLGFQTHDAWDRERGEWTHRGFDNTSIHDPDPDHWGGRHFPYVGRASTTRVTPRAAVPTPAELADFFNTGPGLDDSHKTDVRIRSQNTDYTLRDHAGDRVLEVLPTSSLSSESETTAVPWLTGTPEYVSIATGYAHVVHTTSEFDAYGNPTSVTSTRGGGSGGVVTTREQRIDYDHRPDRWQVRRPSRVLDRQFDADDPEHDARIVRTHYDAVGNADQIETNALDGGLLCPPGDIHACELRATITRIVSDARGNPIVTQVTAADTGESRTTRVAWDADGVYPTTVTDPMGFTTSQVRHPALGVPTSSTDENGVTTTMSHDGFGRLVAAYRPGSVDLTRTFTEITGLRRGLRISDHRNDLSELVRDTDELGRTTYGKRLGFDGAWAHASVTYDLYGNQVGVSRPELTATPVAWTVSDYDRLGQLLMTTTPANATTIYDPTLAETTTLDPELHESYVRRDQAGRIIESGHRVGGTPKGAMRFSYGPFDQTARVVDSAGNAIVLEYDPFGRLIEEQDPDTGKSIASYDGFGQRFHEERANGDNHNRWFDALGRPTLAAGPDGMTVYAYDTGPNALGRLTEVVSPEGIVTDLTYDMYGRVHQLDQTVDGDTDSMNYRYDAVGRLLYAFYPEVPGFDRFKVAYSYGPGGHLDQIRDASSCTISTTQGATDPTCSSQLLWEPTTRDARQALTTATYGNGVVATRSYDPASGLLDSLSAAGVTTTYHHDLDGLLDERTETTTNRTERFRHDDLHRLTRWEMDVKASQTNSVVVSRDTDYEYDDLGNLTGVITDGTSTYGASYGVAGTRPHVLASNTVVGASIVTDPSGRQELAGTRETRWNRFNLPTSITTPTMTRLFRYDGGGGRVSREDASGKIRYLGQLYQHRDTIAIGQIDSFFVHGEPGVVAQVDYTPSGRKVHYVVGDPLSSATIVTNDAGVVEEHAYFEPFGGRVDVIGQPVGDPVASTTFGFTGHEEDGDGLINMQGRIYDRGQFRFLTPDAVVAAPLFGQAYNPYSYVLNDPVDLFDPTGFEPAPGCTYEDPYPAERLNPGTTTRETEYGTIIDVGTMVVRGDAGLVKACDQPPPPPPPPPPRFKNVEKKAPWGLPTPTASRMFASVREVFGSGRSWEERVHAVSQLATTDFKRAGGELGVNALIAMPQAPVLSFMAYSDHHDRALALEAADRNDAANDEWLAMAQEGFLGVGETVGLAVMLTPKPPPPSLITIDISTDGLTAAEASSVLEYATKSNQWLNANGRTTIQSTQGHLGVMKKLAARLERARAEAAGTPYQHQAGHVPDTAVTGLAVPPMGWLDMPGRSNSVCGGVLGPRVGKAFDLFTVNGVIP